MTDTRTATARRSAASSARGPASDRERPDRARAGSWPVRERSLIGPVLGVPPLVAVLLAVGLTALGVFVDLLRIGTVGLIFELAYGVGCVVAVAWVRRRSLFLPAIQPPLLLAVVVPVLAVLVGAPSSTAGVTEHLLLAGAPLINAFPAMAVTTVLVLLVAGFRLVRQRTGPDDAVARLRSRLSGRPAPADDGAPARRGRDAGDGRPSGKREPARPEKAERRSPGTGRDRKRAADGRPSSARDATRSGGARRTEKRDAPRADGPADAARRTPRGSASRDGRSRAGRPARGSGSGRPPGDSARSRRPRPSDPD